MCSAWETFDWVVVIFAAVMLFAMMVFLVKARKAYEGPVAKVMAHAEDEIANEDG